MFYAATALDIIQNRQRGIRYLKAMDLKPCIEHKRAQESGIDDINRGYRDSLWEVGPVGHYQVLPERPLM